MTAQMYLAAIVALLVIVTTTVGFIKKLFKLDGNKVRIVGIVVSIIIAVLMFFIFAVAWWKCILIAIGLTCSSCGGFDTVKDIAMAYGSAAAAVKKLKK